jgi:hypothetical protein
VADSPPKTNEDKTGLNLKALLAPIVAIVALLAFAYFVIYMMGQITLNETQWTRAVYLFTGVESIAFAAAGFFFGSEVRRQQAESANERADEAQNEADAANDRANAAENRATEAEANGNALVAAIRAETEAQRTKAGPVAILQAGEALKVAQADFEKLLAQAEELFPR